MPGTLSDEPSNPFAQDADGLPRVGEVIASKYEIERILGAGGMGVVVAARHVQLGQRVAIKFIRGEVARADAAMLARFMREARAAVALSSEHVAKVLDVGTLPTGAPYMVMEHLDGLDLAAMLERSGPMTVADATRMVLQASEAIAEAHARGIVHRDLKPANLFVTQGVDGGPVVKVLDFGISKVAEAIAGDAGQGLTQTGTMMGSPGYMSPEQVRNSKGVDARTDVWALGLILYELVTGAHPFRGETLGETFSRILTEPVASARTLRPDLPEALDGVIRRCLERDVAHRTQSVLDLAVGLSPFAPVDALRSVERIRRVAGVEVPSRVVVEETLLAPQSSVTSSASRMGAALSGHTDATAKPWQSVSPSASTGKGGTGLKYGIAGGCVLVASIGVALLVSHAHPSGARDAVESASAPAAPAPTPLREVSVTPPAAAMAPPVTPATALTAAPPTLSSPDAGAPAAAHGDHPSARPVTPFTPPTPLTPRPHPSTSPPAIATHHETDVF
jgi:serine/threonine protein kinase